MPVRYIFAVGFFLVLVKIEKCRPPSMPILSYEPGSKLLALGMVIQPLIGNPYNGYINPYYWVDDHPLLYGNNGSLDPSTYCLLRYDED